VKILALIAAYEGSGMIAATVRAVRSLGDVSEVVVVDDGSTDETAERAAAAGARVLRAPRNLGKGGALEGALARLPPVDVLLLLDQDLGDTAAAASSLLGPVVEGEADMTIAQLPRDPRHGGFRLVKRLSGWMIRRLCGFPPQEPMSGQRAVSARALEAARPLAPGFGVELGMTVDVVRAGMRVVEVPVEMSHAPTGRDLRGFLHRARQGRDHVRAALARVRP